MRLVIKQEGLLLNKALRDDFLNISFVNRNDKVYRNDIYKNRVIKILINPREPSNQYQTYD